MEDQGLAVHRAIVVVDVEGFGDRRRTNTHQVAVRDGLYRVMRDAFGRAGVSWDDCGREDRGDGVLVLVPAEVPKGLLAESLPSALAAGLRAHNGGRPGPEQIRLRVALHAGEVRYDEHGVTGASVNLAFRLLEAAVLKAALAGSPGVLAVIVSSWFFEEVVRHGNAAAGYGPVEVAVKETRTTGWICLPDHEDPASAAIAGVLPPAPGSAQLIRSVYLEQVRDIAPDELIGREAELAEWTEFCAGTEAYSWWQAGPWAGKTALASWFVTHPPAGVEVVSFFITGRLAGQADGDTFLDAMIEQLRAIESVSDGPAVAAGARVGAWLSLLAIAAAQAEERGRRLIIVVDGLDEDDAGASAPRGGASIASLLPRRLPRGVQVIVTSRPDPGVPDDVPSGHPLRTCTPRQLTAAWVARDLARRAQQELRDLLTGDQTGLDVVGYIAASGGGLTRSDLSALTGAPPRKLDPILRGVSGRSLETRTLAGFRDAAVEPELRVHLFAHETLRITAEEQLGDELARYRQGIHEWIGSYASRGWPDGTPGYAIRGYPGLLTASSDAERLSALARDSRRHAFLSRATGSDYAALAEISNTQRLIAGHKTPDMQVLVELAIYRHAISIRNQSIPVGLPAVWERLGRFEHAEALARAVTDPDDQARALTEVARAAAQAGDPARASRLAADAEAVARTVTSPGGRARVLTEVALMAAQAGDLDHAETLARAITSPGGRVRMLAELTRAFTKGGHPDRAEALARTLISSEDQAIVLSEAAHAAAEAGDPARASRLAADAEALARTTTSPGARTQVLTEVARVAAQVGDLDRAETLAHSITDPGAQARALTEAAHAAAEAGDPACASRLAADAEALARTTTSPHTRAWMLTEVARVAAETGDLDRAEALASTITRPDHLGRAFTEVARAAAQAGDLDRAEVLAQSITDLDARARALTEVARVAAESGDLDHAETLASTITRPDHLGRALTEVARMAAQAGDLDRAETLANGITRPYARARALTEVARAAAEAGDPGRATRLAADAEALAHAATSQGARARALAELARAAAQVGDLDRAEALAHAITDPRIQVWALAEVARLVAEAGDLDRAEALARATTDPGIRARALTEVARVAAQAGDPGRVTRLAADVEALAHSVTSPGARVQALADVARVVAEAGDLNRAEALARATTDPGTRARALTEVAHVAAQAGDTGRVTRLAADAEALASAITDKYARARALTDVARLAAQIGDLDRAEALARPLTPPNYQALALTEVARVAAEAGDLHHAMGLIQAITSPYDRARALTEMARAAVQAGDPDDALRLAADAEAQARAITDPGTRTRPLTEVARVAAQAGDPEGALRLAADAEALARAITDPGVQAMALTEVARVAAEAGDLDRAVGLAQAITSPGTRAQLLTQVARMAFQNGDPDRAQHLLAQALTVEPPQIQWCIEGVSRLFPSAIRGAGDVFLSAYETGG